MFHNLKSVLNYVVKRFTNPIAFKIKSRKLTYLSFDALKNIQEVIYEVERSKVPGCFIETGCALGGSTIVIGRAKSKKRQLKVYDVFGMIPPPTEKDGEDVQKRYEVISSGEAKGINGDLYYGYKKDLKNVVINNLEKFGLDLEKDNIELIQGLYEETLSAKEPVAFAHIDCDWYSSVMTCLREIEPHLAKHGVIIIDDYYAWSGCKTAVDEYFTPELKSNYTFQTKANKLIIKKN
ncbi:MAG: class I SAM-dependent methyltransferase [Chitinophagaceae bacterium]|nr:class I SAM-dependent methyltransferase [Chitinophagaceae bacterium]